MAIALTAARQRVVDCLARGLSYAETARELHIARDTVKAHVFSIFRLIPNPRGLKQKEAVVDWIAQAAREGNAPARQNGHHTASP